MNHSFVPRFVMILLGVFGNPVLQSALPNLEPHTKNRGILEEAFLTNLKEQLSERMGLPPSLFSLELENFLTDSAWKSSEKVHVQILGLGTGNFRRIDGLFQVPILIQSAHESLQVQAQGLLKIVGPAYVARHSLLRGQNLSQEDLTQVLLPWNQLPTGVAAQSWQTFVGRRLRAHVEAGQSIPLEQLEEALAVKNGDIVELTLFSGSGVMIRSHAIAKQEGRVGDVIRLGAT